MTFSDHTPQQKTNTSDADPLKNASQLQKSFSGSPDNLIASNDTQGFARGSDAGKNFEPEGIDPVKETKCGPATRPSVLSPDQNPGQVVDTGPLPEDHWSTPFANQTEGVPTVPQAPTSVTTSGQASNSEESLQDTKGPTFEGDKSDYQKRNAELMMLYNESPEFQKDSTNLHLDKGNNSAPSTHYKQSGNTATSKTTLLKEKNTTLSGKTKFGLENQNSPIKPPSIYGQGEIELKKGNASYFLSGKGKYTPAKQKSGLQIETGVRIPLSRNKKKKNRKF